MWPALASERYEVRRVIGRGGMGTVYAAYDRTLEREVALKVSNAAARDDALDARLGLEARVLARLEHPGIVPVHDAGVLDDGRWYYVMKRVDGETLTQHAARLHDESAILGLFERVAETVASAHANAIVHRDLKPSNVMVGAYGEVLVLDWGVAKLLDAAQGRGTGEGRAIAPVEGTSDTAASAATNAGTRMGTPGFMAPEQQQGHASTVSPAADVYALGALLYWLFTGAVPPDDADAAAARLASASRSVPPRRLRAIVRRCLSAAPANRYVDASALVADLGRYRAGHAVDAHPESMLERAWRVVEPYRAFIGLMLAYLVMRALFAWAQRR